METVGWDIDGCWSDRIWREEESMGVCWQRFCSVEDTCCFRFGEIVDRVWRLVSVRVVSVGISICGSSFMWIWSEVIWVTIGVCSFELSNIEGTIINNMQ